MKIVNLVYKVLFNLVAKKDGVTSSTYIIAGSAMSLVCMFIMGGISVIYRIATQNYIYAKANKPFGMLITVICMYLVHLLLFYVFKFDKRGNRNDGTFEVNPNLVNRVYFFLVLMIVIGIGGTLGIAASKQWAS